MKITRLDRVSLNDLIQEFTRLAASRGVTLKVQGGSIRTVTDAEIRMTLQIRDATGSSMVEKTDFERYCHYFGLKPADYMRPFTNNGKTYRLVGFEPSRPKYCVRGRGMNNKDLLFTRGVLQQLKSSLTTAA